MLDLALAWSDSILIAAGDRLVVLGPDGSIGRIVRLSASSWGMSRIVGVSSEQVFLEGDLLQSLPSGLGLDSVRILSLDRHSGAVSESLQLPSRPYFHRSGPGATDFLAYPPFFPVLAATVHKDRLTTGDGGSARLSLYEGGAVSESLDLPLDRRTITDQEIAFEVRRREEEARGRPHIATGWAALFADVNLPEYHPYFDRVLSDRSDRLWVRRPPRSNELETTWFGLDGTGALLRQLVVPSDWDIQQIDEEYALVVVLDDLDVPVVGLAQMVPSR